MLLLMNFLCYLSRSLLILVMQMIVCRNRWIFILVVLILLFNKLIDTFESTDKNNSEEEEYSIAKDRPRRDIRPPQKYVNFVAYVMSVTDTNPPQKYELVSHQTLDLDEESS